MDNPLSDLPGYELRRASTALMAELAGIIGPHDLRVAEVSVLLVIAANKSANQSDLCRLLDIQRANMAPLAARLEARGMIQRLPVNGRSHNLALTAAGDACVAALQRDIEAFENDVMSRIPLEHRAGFIAALKALRR
jgi:DNA-binding MarR family transcriptional regulator